VEPWQASATEVVDLIRTRQLSPSELVESLLSRIEAMDGQLLAWVTVDADGARRAADELTERLARGEPTGRLGGLPLGLKDVFWTKNLRTTASSKALQDFVPDQDAAAVESLRRADGILLGKVHTAEFACADPAPTRNPWRDGHTPGGSSSGSGAAVAAGMVPVALGTQTGGSTLRPAAYNGIVGFKPTYGLVSNRGVIPLAWSFDHVGILARSVADVALVLETIAEYDPLDPASLPPELRSKLDASLERDHPPVIGLVNSFFLDTCEPDVLHNVDEVVANLCRSGADIREVALPNSFSRITDDYPVMAWAETAAYHEEGIAERYALYGPKIAGLVRDGATKLATDYVRAVRARPEITRDIEQMLMGCDAILTPTTPAPAPRNMSITGDPSYLIPFSYAGLPAISLPSGVTNWGLPLGVQLAGRRGGDGSLLATAAWCERVIDFALRPPCW
jgi:aspartyl-tRNA(Asn)/glutamyl-tRNA(Gln) amidotransferase subunit A